MIGKKMEWKGYRISPAQILVLTVVKDDPKYGYEILRDLRDLFEDVWKPETGALYPSIRKMLDAGLLIGDNVDGKEYYSLSDDGRSFLKESLLRLASMASFATRFSAVVSKTLDEMTPPMEELEMAEHLTKEKRLKDLMELRRIVEADLMNVNYAIEHIAGSSEDKT